MDILKNIKYKKSYVCKSKMCAGNQYRITLKYNNKIVWFYFHDNIYNNSNLKDFVWCLLLDAQIYYNNQNNYNNFCWELGFDPYDTKNKKIYKACQKQFERLNKLFNKDEVAQLEKEFENY